MKAYQLKITLKDIKPPIWRRFIVPAGLSFSQLTLVIHKVMGWSGYHLSEYTFKNLCIKLTEENEDYFPLSYGDMYFANLCSADFLIDEMFERVKSFTYTYDFGDNWSHQVQIENVIEDYEYAFPMVLKYKGEIPPEDCGGPDGYYNLLDILSNPDGPEYETMKEWYDYQSVDQFDLDEVNKELSRMKKTMRKIKPVSENQLYKKYFEGKIRFDQVISPEDRYEEADYDGYDSELDIMMDDDLDVDMNEDLLDSFCSSIIIAIHADIIRKLMKNTSLKFQEIKNVLELDEDNWDEVVKYMAEHF